MTARHITAQMSTGREGMLRGSQSCQELKKGRGAAVRDPWSVDAIHAVESDLDRHGDVVKDERKVTRGVGRWVGWLA